MRRISFEEANALCGIGWEEARDYTVLWYDDKVGVCGLRRLLYHWTVAVNMDAAGYSRRYCYASEWLATNAFDEWNGEGRPDYWHKDPQTEEYRHEIRFRDLIVHVENGVIVALTDALEVKP